LPILAPESLRGVVARLEEADRAFALRYPGDSGERQPVHSVYGGAQLFKADTAARLGAFARQAFATHAAEPEQLAGATGIPAALAATVHARVAEKLRREPVEDFRIDFEDGYGSRPDAEEDGHAEAAAREMAVGQMAGTLPPFVGIRIKPLNKELAGRSARTLELFLRTLVRETGGALPENFVVTLPKVTIPEQVAGLADLFDLLEPELGLAAGALRLELMVETPQSIFDDRGRAALPLLAAAGRGRTVAAHFGAYDYTAACGITAAHQSLAHAACDFARHMMQVTLAGSGLRLSDGSTTILPIAPHRERPDGPPLTAGQQAENRAAIHRAWGLHASHVRHSLVHGFYQGWDLHPAQLVSRYAAVYAFFLAGLDAASDRLRNFVQKAAQATLVGDVFDDAATGQGLLNYFLRAVNCGAISEEEALERSGLTLDELQGRSFARILETRRK
jgi:hypothetical protein